MRAFMAASLLVWAGSACAATISSASSGLWTDTNTWSTLTVPSAADNVTILNSHTVTVNDAVSHPVSNFAMNAGAVLRHSDNSSAESFKIIIAIGGNCTINSNAQINVDYRGYDRGKGPGASSFSADGKGAGGSYGGLGGRGYDSAGAGDVQDVYGSVHSPTNLGSGGNNYANCGSGGGAVKLTIQGAFTNNGTIAANGQDYLATFKSGGAAGTIWIIADTLAGSGSIAANGGAGSWGGGGAGGRIAIKLTSGSDFGNVTMTAYGGEQDAAGGQPGAAGTIYQEKADGSVELIIKNNISGSQTDISASENWDFERVTIQGYGDLGIPGGTTLTLAGNEVLNGDGSSASLTVKDGGTLTVPSGFSFGSAAVVVKEGALFDPAASITVQSNGVLRVDGAHNFSSPITVDAYASMILGSGPVTNNSNLILNGTLTHKTSALTVLGNMTIGASGNYGHADNAASETYKIDLTVAGNLTISNGQINVDYLGYDYGKGPGASSFSADGKGAGGSYGGLGGRGYDSAGATDVQDVYGSVHSPTNLGSGGNNKASCGSGGGAVKLTIQGAFTNNGTISANGQDYLTTFRSGGAAGSIWIIAGTLAGSGSIIANGGAGNVGGGGAGGRIAIKLTSGSDVGSVTMTAYGGDQDSSWGSPGAAGTVYLQKSTESAGEGALTVDNASQPKSTVATTLFSTNVTDTTFGDIIIQNAGKLQLDDNQSLTVNGSWSNSASFAADTGSTVTFAGTNDAFIYGSSTFYNLTCTNGAKLIKFEANTTNTVVSKLTLAGVTLHSTVNDTWWYLTLVNAGEAYQEVRGVRARDSNAEGGQTIVIIPGWRSLDEGHNVNWRFPSQGTIFQIR